MNIETLIINRSESEGLQRLTSNFSGNAKLRHDSMEGRDFLVAPMVMMVEGVHSGSEGPLYYPPEELAKYTTVWNSKPVVVYHPEEQGQSISACSPRVFNSQKIGVIMNTVFEDGKLKAEAWLEIKRINEVDPRILDALEKGEMVEVSTGLFTQNEACEAAVWNGEEYSYIARDYRPDHLAILPDKKGACSIADGAGLLRNSENQSSKIKEILKAATDQILNVQTEAPLSNELSHSDIREELARLILESFGSMREGSYIWVMDVFDDFLIFEKDENLFQIGYSMESNQVSIDDEEPIEVTRVTSYMTKTDGALIGNIGENQKEPEMDKATLVGNIIANNASTYEEADRDYLMGLEDNRLNSIKDQLVKNSEPTATVEPIEPIEPAADVAPVGDITAEEFIKNAPAEIQAVLKSGITANKNKKAQLIGVITNAPGNTFAAEVLETYSLDQLSGIAALCSAEPVANQVAPNYMGASVPAPVANTGASVDDGEPLVMASLD